MLLLTTRLVKRLTLILALSIGCGAGLAAVLGCWVLNRPGLRPGETPGAGITEGHIAFLLRDGRIYNASRAAQKILAGLRFEDAGWDQVRARLAPAFPDLPAQAPDRTLHLHAVDLPETRLTIQPEADFLRIELTGRPPTAAEMVLFLLQSAELDMLRVAMASIPSPFWESDATGWVIWANAAYQDLSERAGSEALETPLFDLVLPEASETSRVRVSVRSNQPDAPAWYEVTTRNTNATWLHHAVDIDAVVRAETAQRNFVQTLTKTFAHLPIGLAIFDRDRQLALFNPALIDLTSLPANFLSGRPNLLSFFDHMRENRMMPEPKNYTGWREQMAELVAAASDDRYSETWSLPSGLTYKITGRPHPDGAIAFLIEDISAEISLTRRFRAEMELSQSVLDAIEDAVAVFSHLGVLTYCNAAYRELWKTDPDSAFAEMTVLDATRHWQMACEPNPIWADLREFALESQDRAAWGAELMLKTGQSMECRVEPLVGGATVVCFSGAAPRTIPKVQNLHLSTEG